MAYIQRFNVVSTLSLDLERLVVDSVALTKTISTSRDEIRNILLTLDRLRLILSILLTPGLSDDIDSICDGKLKVMSSSATVGLSRCVGFECDMRLPHSRSNVVVMVQLCYTQSPVPVMFGAFRGTYPLRVL
jgi:hypothetical protein